MLGQDVNSDLEVAVSEPVPTRPPLGPHSASTDGGGWEVPASRKGCGVRFGVDTVTVSSWSPQSWELSIRTQMEVWTMKT